MTILSILNESTDFSSGEKVIESIKNNEAGVSAKKFFNETDKDGKEIQQAIVMFDKIIKDCKEFNLDRTKVIKLIIKKAGDVVSLNDRYSGIDPYVAYFKNRDKQEAKTTHKELFDDFINSKTNIVSDHRFEKRVNDIFAGKQNSYKAKEGKKQLYGPDEKGWEVFIPTTFEAASEFSTTVEGKTKWCTAASKRYFDYYSREGSPLYILRNYKEGIAYQFNFQDDREETVTQIMDKDDERPANYQVKDLVNSVPDEALKTITHNGKDLLKMKDTINKMDVKKELDKPFKVEKIDGWDIQRYHVDSESQLKNILTVIEKNDADYVDRFFNNSLKYKNIGQVDFYKKGNEENAVFYTKVKGTTYKYYFKKDHKTGEFVRLSTDTFEDRLHINSIPTKNKKIVFYKDNLVNITREDTGDEYDVYTVSLKKPVITKYGSKIDNFGVNAKTYKNGGFSEYYIHINENNPNNTTQYTTKQFITNFSGEDQTKIISILKKIIPDLSNFLTKRAILSARPIFGHSRLTNTDKADILDAKEVIKKVRANIK